MADTVGTNTSRQPTSAQPVPLRSKHRNNGDGLRVRLRPVKHLTPKDVLKDTLHFPAVVSDPFEITQEAMHSNYDTVSSGELSQPAGGKHSRRLEVATFDILTLNWDARWLAFPGVDPHRVKKVVSRIIASGAPLHLLAHVYPHLPGYQGPEWDCLVTLRSSTRRLSHGEADTRYYSFSISEYREPGLRRRRHGGGGDKLPTTHKLTAHESLRDLSKKYYGNRTMWRTIAHANGIKKWGPSVALVQMKRYKVGDRVKIPRKPKRGHGGNGNGTGGTPASRAAETVLDDGLYIEDLDI